MESCGSDNPVFQNLLILVILAGVAVHIVMACVSVPLSLPYVQRCQEKRWMKNRQGVMNLLKFQVATDSEFAEY